MKYYLGLDLGGTNIVAGVVDESYNIVAKETLPTFAHRSVEEIVNDMFEVSKKTVDKAGLTMSDFSSWGIGMPSYVNPKNHLLIRANNLNWINLPIYDYLKVHTDLPIYIENDANCAALGETLVGAAKEYKDTLLITLGTGVGGGIILNNTIFTGNDMMGAELGHTKLVYNGIRCTCGQRGCMESYCSATALIRQVREALSEDQKSILWDMCQNDLGKIDGKLIFEACDKQDYLAKKVVDQYIDYLSCGLSSFITIFRPEAIIIGGGLAAAGDTLFLPLQTKLFENTFAATEIGIPNIISAKLGNDAGIIGAALLEKHAKQRLKITCVT